MTPCASFRRSVNRNLRCSLSSNASCRSDSLRSPQTGAGLGGRAPADGLPRESLEPLRLDLVCDLDDQWSSVREDKPSKLCAGCGEWLLKDCRNRVLVNKIITKINQRKRKIQTVKWNNDELEHKEQRCEWNLKRMSDSVHEVFCSGTP